MSLQSSVIDLNEANFQQTLEQSLHTPVLFYFFSPQHPDCQTLTPIVDKLVRLHSPYLILAKLDCNEYPQIAAQFGLRDLPTLYLFQNGQPIDGLQGLQSEATVTGMLSKVLPKEDEIKVDQANALIEKEQYAEALPLLRDAWQVDNSNSNTALLLAETLIELNRSDEASDILTHIPLQDQDTRYQGLLAKIDLLNQAANSPEISQLQQQLEQTPDDYPLLIKLAIQLHQVGRNEQALQQLFQVLSQDLQAEQGAVRSCFQEIITALGTSDKLANQYRRRLYSLLY